MISGGGKDSFQKPTDAVSKPVLSFFPDRRDPIRARKQDDAMFPSFDSSEHWVFESVEVCDHEIVSSVAGSLPDETDLRTYIINAFSAEPYEGQITPVDGMEWSEELDDDIDLWQSLTGKSWREVPDEFVDRHYNDLVLFSPGAFAAFLPAWLTRALVNSHVREHTIYSLIPHPPLEKHWQDRVSSLLPQQIDCVKRFLSSVREHGDQWIREDALIALDALPC